MDYLKHRGCNVSVISRAVADQAPLPQAERDLGSFGPSSNSQVENKSPQPEQRGREKVT